MKKLLVILLLSVAEIAVAQKANIAVGLDTTDIKIGEQTGLNLEAKVGANEYVLLPAPTDSLAFALEVVKRSNIDSLVNGNEKTYRQKLMITSFDSGYHAIPPLPFTIINAQGETDSVYSKPILIGVHTVAIDTTQAIKDIKGPKGAPLSFAEVWPYLLIFILLAIGGYLGYRYWQQQKNKPKLPAKEPEKPKEPAHIIALRDLEKLKEEKVWQSGAHKAYYSRLTEIVRAYIEYRFEIPALEQTSDEIISALKQAGVVERELISKLAGTFADADLVKFAKMNPLPEENERGMRTAFYFVEETKQVKDSLPTENKEKSDTEKATQPE
jgi:hypothetical protein